jgi:hypothetical protein
VRTAFQQPRHDHDLAQLKAALVEFNQGFRDYLKELEQIQQRQGAILLQIDDTSGVDLVPLSLSELRGKVNQLIGLTTQLIHNQQSSLSIVKRIQMLTSECVDSFPRNYQNELESFAGSLQKSLSEMERRKKDLVQQLAYLSHIEFGCRRTREWWQLDRFQASPPIIFALGMLCGVVGEALSLVPFWLGFLVGWFATTLLLGLANSVDPG